MNAIPPISKGLGRFTPELWSRMSQSIYVTEGLSSSATQLAKSGRDQNPVTFPAKIKGFKKFENFPSGYEDPRRQYEYQWEEVSVQYSRSGGLTVSTFNSARVSGTPDDENYTPAFNGSEVGLPDTRSGSIQGVNLSGYPEKSGVMPSVNSDEPVGSEGEPLESGTCDGPLVMLTLLSCKDSDEEGSQRVIGFFYSGVNIDGVCG
jgi:hypothetical protein